MSVGLDTMLVRTPGTCGGKLRIDGTRITVMHIAALHNQRYTAEMIVDQHRHLNLAQVHAALAYYHANRDEIDAALDEEEQEFDRLKAEYESRKSQ